MTTTHAEHKKSWGHSFENTASVVITAEYYPWQTNKTYTIDYKIGGYHVLEGSTNGMPMTGNPFFGVDGKSAKLSVNQHEIKFVNFERTTIEDKNWTQSQMHEQWRTSSYRQDLTLNLVTLKIQSNDKFTSSTMKKYSGTRDETNFDGECTVIKPNFKI
jgi:hypothetical protein